MNEKSKESRIAVRIDDGLHNWVKMYAQRSNKTMSVLIIEYLEALRRGESVREPENQLKSAQGTRDASSRELERADSEIHYLRDHLARRDDQLERRDEQIEALTRALDHAQQLQLLAQKQVVSLSERLELIEDQRQRNWWQKLVGK